MDQSKAIDISGRDLTIDQVAQCADDPGICVRLTSESTAAMAAAQAFLAERVSAELIYGVNTGFGPMASCVLGRDQLVELQYNLIRSHATGIGEPLPQRLVLAAMLVRLNTIARGTSAVSPELGRSLEGFINRRIVPVVPEHGAVGTSGDLVQLAHVGLALIGEGEVFHNGARADTSCVLRSLGLAPHRLRPKEGLALINGTAAMTGIAALVCADAERILDLAIRTGAWSLEISRAFDDSLLEALHDLRPHPGQRRVAALLRYYVGSSPRLRSRRAFYASEAIGSESRSIPAPVQEVYSIRCIPQILGPIDDALRVVRERVSTELNSVTDNPILIREQGCFAHGGNFHGDYVAVAMDQLKIAMVKLVLLSERRINYYLNANVNRILPPFLNGAAVGLNLGLQALQFVATSTAAASQTLGYPQCLHSIPTNGDNQDVVSMGTDAALFTKKVVENALVVLTIEAVTLAQAVDCLDIAPELSQQTRAFYDAVRSVLPTIRADRSLTPELEQLVTRLRSPISPDVTPAAVLGNRDRA